MYKLQLSGLFNMEKKHKVCFFMIHPAPYHNAVLKQVLNDERINAHVVFYLKEAHSAPH